MKVIDISEIGKFAKVLHCGIRWRIIEFLREGPKSSEEIFQFLVSYREKIRDDMKECKGICHHENVRVLKKPTLYYHLRELESVGIINLAEYKPSKENRAPEKVWKLNIDKLIIKIK